MLLYHLFKHQWKNKIRSSFWQKSIVLNIILGFTAVYLMLNIIAISLFVDKILLHFYKDCDVIESFTRLLFYYFSFDLIVRFLMQELPILSIQPYLILPIKKSQLLHYPLIKSSTSFFNVLAILLIIPFFIKNICFSHSFQFCIIWIITMLSFVGTNNFVNFTIKKNFAKRPFVTLIFICVLGLVVYLDIAKIFSVSQFFFTVVFFIARNTYLILIPVLLLMFSYYIAYTFLKRNAYIEDTQQGTKRKFMGMSFFDRYGEIGQLLGLEIKMILRNKRPKSLLIFSCIFFLYGFIFYKKENIGNDLILSLAGLLLPSMFSLNYAQLIFSWESSYFDSVLTNRISIVNYIKSKYIFVVLTYILGYFIILPFAYINYKIALVNTAFLLFNVGCTTMIILFFSTFNSSYVDLGRSQIMNHQGTGVMNFIVVIPILGIPFLLYFIFKTIGRLDDYYYIIAIIGIIGITLNKYLEQFVMRQFSKRKYKMALGFRQK